MPLLSEAPARSNWAPLAVLDGSYVSCASSNPRFFEDYKKNEHKEVVVDEFLGADAARKCVVESLVGQTPVV